MTTLSIVTKTYNRCAFLRECIESVQKIKNEPFESDIQWEHVIYDDGSQDETQDYCRTHPISHVRYVRSEENEGVSTAANKAIQTCESDWIFELDSDDFVPSRVLANFHAALQTNPSAKWFVMDFYRVDSRGVYEMGQDYYGWNYNSPTAVLKAIFSGNHFIQHNVIYKKEIWQSVGKYRDHLNMAEDLDIYIRFLLQGHMPVYLPTISHFHRNHGGNISKGVTIEDHKKDLRNLAKIYQIELEKNGVYVGT